MNNIYFWQRMVTPHMAYLAIALAKKGVIVNYVAEEPMSSERAAQGWEVPELPGVRLHYASSAMEVDALLTAAPKMAIHICQGIRGNGMVQIAQKKLRKMQRCFWVIMETIDDSGLKGILKRIYYHFLLFRIRNCTNGFLAIGRKTAGWLADRGVSKRNIYPFTYFLQDYSFSKKEYLNNLNSKFHFLFVGQLIERKRIDLLFRALKNVSNDFSFCLHVIGAGPLENDLRILGEKFLGNKLEWLGTRSMEETRQYMERADCLVLPSRHDGWGAVVSEALMAGTPAICSDRCGAAEAVLASGVGGVFPSGDEQALTTLLVKMLHAGPQTREARARLSQWGQCLGATKGADYLMEVLESHETGAGQPFPPWRQSQ